MKVLKAIVATLGVSLCFFYLGCGSGIVPQLAGTPNIRQVFPQTIAVGSPATTMQVVGANFTNQAVILWNGNKLKTTVVDSNTLAGTIQSDNLTSPATVQLRVKDSVTGAESQSVPVTVAAAQTASNLQITTTQLPSATVGASYSATLAATGTSPSDNWSITSGSLPSGLSLAQSSGTISGTPTAAGTFTFGVTITGTASSASATLTLTVVNKTATVSALSISSTSLPSGTSGKSYNASLSASGGTPGYTWSITSGSLPSGLSLSSSGTISGAPTASGTFTFTTTVTDSGSPAQAQSATLSITVASAPSALTITTSALPSGTTGKSYNASLSASGGTPGYTWSIASGSLPSGLTLSSSGTISGTPTASGTSNFTATVSDNGSPAQAQSATLSITVAGAPSALTITTSSLPSGTAGKAYSTTLSASGGTPGYTWSITSGSLPSGLTLSSSGTISGAPTASGTANFTATVSDNGSPAQAKSATLSITIAGAPSALTITTSSLPSGTAGKTYSTALQASGGTPAYTWSITSGSLPAGLTLAATSGTISGTPTASGTVSFTATVSDNGSPAQITSASVSIVVAAAQQSTGTTWYVNGSGGSRYSVNNPGGLCDGTSPAAPVGATPNQHCAFNDIRYLWSDGSYTTDPGAGAPAWGWIGQGGDTYIVDCPAGNTWCRIGQSGPNGGDFFGLAGNPYAAGAPVPPSGTATAHTRILGLNYASCTSPSAKAHINAGYGVARALSLDGTSYVDVQCIELTDHAQCSRVGATQFPSTCSSSYPLDDYATGGIDTTSTTTNILMQDMDIHGFTHYGLFGPIGTGITMTRVNVNFNGSAGWEFDDGYASQNGPNASINASYVTMTGNGCNEEYPITHAFPAISCYDDASGGFGDAWSAQGTGRGGEMAYLSMTCDHCVVNYNTKDGFGMNHILFNSLSITNSTAYGNMGQQWKWSTNNGAPVTFANNLTVGNCRRMSAPMAGAPSNYNQFLSDFCRAAGDNISLAVSDGGNTLVAGNTVVGYAATTFDIACSGTNTDNCASATLNFRDNLYIGFSNPNYNGGILPGIYYKSAAVTVGRDHNLYFNQRNSGCPTTGAAGEICADPLLVNEPASLVSVESDLDNFNFTPSSSSPAIGAGVSVSAITTDSTGKTRSNPTAMGAIEP